MNYKIIGQDGNLYGPAGAEQIRQWISQGRLESRTPILPEAGGEWTFVGLLPEFAGLFSPPPVGVPGRPFETARPGINPLATWSLVCGCLSWVFCCCCPVNLLGLIFGLVALSQTAGRPPEGRNLAIAGVILSATNLLWCLGLSLLDLVNGQSKVMWSFGQN